ncbi:type II secretion system protein [Sulfurimonas sp.]
MKFRKAFTMLELIFVIVVMGIIGKFGVEFLAQAYQNFIFSSINNTLQSNSATTVEFISSRLQHRIKDSIIVRDTSAANSFIPLASATSATANTYNALEWVGSDIDGFRGNSDAVANLPNWSGIIDLDVSTNSTLVSTATDTGKVDTLIDVLSYGDSNFNSSAALYFIGSSSDVINGYGWSGAITDQNQTMHPVIIDITSVDSYNSNIGNFNEVYEYYKLAWTAYALVHDTATNELWFHYDYQPWNGDKWNDGSTKKELLMENVDTFQFMAIGSIVKIQVCVNTSVVEDYSLCKEKTIY